MSKLGEKNIKKFVIFFLKKDVFLNRNLNFNKPSKLKLNEYYTHTMSKNCSVKSMIKFIKEFQQSRNNKDDTNELIIVNMSNYKTVKFGLEEDYYSDCNACLICRKVLHNIGALILHYKLVHLEYNVFHFVSFILTKKNKNPFTDLKEAHILLFFQKDYLYEQNITEEKNFNFQSSKTIKSKLAINYLTEIDILKLNLNLNSGEAQIVKYPLSNKKYLTKKDDIKANKLNSNSTNRIFFHSITGEPFDPNDPNYVNSDYDIDESYIRMKEKKDIEDYFDVCEKDKAFFKLWNSFINDNKQDLAIIHLEKLLHKFVRNHFKEIFTEDLKENFFLHLITLYDHSLINKNQIIKVIKDLEENFKKMT